MKRVRLVPKLKGKQVTVSLYLPPRQYWLLKGVSRDTGFSMQFLLRRALQQVLADALKQGHLGHRALPTNSPEDPESER